MKIKTCSKILVGINTGRRHYEEFIKGKFDINECNVIELPYHIGKRISMAYIHGLLEDIIKTYGREALNKIVFSGSLEAVQRCNRIKKGI